MRMPHALILAILTLLVAAAFQMAAAEPVASAPVKPASAKATAQTAHRPAPVRRAMHAKPRTAPSAHATRSKTPRSMAAHPASHRIGQRTSSRGATHGRPSIQRAAYAHPGFGETDRTTSQAEAYGFCGQMQMPAVELSHISRGYRRGHVGIDLMAPRGSPIHAAAAGSILYAGWYYGYGNMVDIRHADGVVTRYAHMSAIGSGIEPGALVLAGDEIGKVGATGHATGPHVHFEVRVGGHAVDPKPYLAMASCNGFDNGPAIQEAYADERPATTRRKQQRRSHRASR